MADVAVPATATATPAVAPARMLRAVGRALVTRLTQLVALLLVVSTALFFLLRLSGDAARVLAGENASPETIELVRAQYGLDRPLVVQYGVFVGQLLRLDFGTSLYNGQDALALVLERAPATLQMSALAVLVSALLAVPIGTWLGARSGGRARNVVTVLISCVQGVPGFVTGLLLIQVFAVWWGVLPSIAGSGWTSLPLPILTLTAFLVPQLIRVLAASTGEVMRQDYVRTAVANGAGRGTVVARHALPNALLGVTALLGSQFAALMSGAMLTEFIFAWPGLGLLLINSVTTLDFPLVQATVFVIAVLVFLVNLAMDIVFQVVDPRLRRRAA
ncbi:ABC transporter permease [Micromonospora sp. NPDC047074]|uniref:ABC transporter permease n=1 Tax=Micromonospora sp. NPDC047074 TaxID=3154339 RepID=UPI003408A57A